MNLLKILGIKPKQLKPYEFADFLHMWEDDHLMVELIPEENFDFLKKETERIDNFGKEHFDGIGFSDITAIGEIPLKTIEKGIDFNSILSIFSKNGMERIKKVAYEGKALTGENIPYGFGSNKFAVILEKEKDKLKYIWTTGRIENEGLKIKLKNAITEFINTHNFIGVDWYKPEFFNLKTKEGIREFVKNSC